MSDSIQNASLKDVLSRALAEFEGLTGENFVDFFKDLEEKSSQFDKNEGASLCYKPLFTTRSKQVGHYEYDCTIDLEAGHGEKVVVSFCYLHEGELEAVHVCDVTGDLL